MKIAQKSRQLAKWGWITAFLFGMTGADPANALDFTFSFSNTTGNTPGTVEGIIRGLNDNSTGAATSIELTSFPSALGTNNTPTNIVSWDSVSFNSFTVSSGSITNAQFVAFDTTTSPNPYFCINDACVSTAGNGNNLFTLNDNPGGNFLANNDALLSGIIFTPVASTPVPFEINPTLGLLLVGGLVAGNRLYRKSQTKKI